MTQPPASFGRVLLLTTNPALVQNQLDGTTLTLAEAGPLRDDISTDEIAPLPAMVHFDAALGAHAHTGFTAGGERPINRGALQRAGIGVLVGGRRYGKGSSREHAPVAELAAGVRLVIAQSFERIYRQNADNLGLLTSTDLGLVERLQRGEVPTGGSAVRALDTDERATLTNMTAELGGLTGIVEPDVETLRFLRERRGLDVALEDWMRSDPGAPYAATLQIDADALSPMVARPGDPGLGLPLADLAERPRLEIAYGGSCTAGKRADFAQYHAVLAWAAARGLKVAPGVMLSLQFGTADVAAHAARQGWLAAFEAVGARMLQPACGACANCGPGSSTDAGQVTVSAINRNFPGRSGPGQVWLASPATVAASAIAGRLVSFAELMAQRD